MTKLPRLFLFVLLIVLSLIACSSINPSGRRDFPVDLLLTAQDLPTGFVRKEYVRVDVPNAEAFGIGFVVLDGSEFPLIRVSHRLAIYADEQSAQAAYPDWEKEIFPVDAWKVPDDFQFKTAVSNDLYRFGCLPGTIDGKHIVRCRYLQQHNDKVSRVLMILDDTVLNLEDVENILKNLDARLSRAK